VAAYYLDSSALVKRYAAEIGTIWIRTITSQGAGHVLFVALIAGAEVVAAFARRERTRSLTAADAQQAISDFQSHFRAQYSVIALTKDIVERAMALAPRLSLRGYDAVQLATALTVNDELTHSGSTGITFVSADSDLNTAAAREGMLVEDPQAHSNSLDVKP